MKARPFRAGLSFLLLALVLCLCVRPVQGQTPPGMPPDIKAIFDKIRAGGTPTDEEEQRLEKWGQSMEKAFAKQPAQPSLSNERAKNACPPSKPEAVATAAPTTDEFVALLRSLADTYGRKIGTRRADLDRSIADIPGSVTGEVAATASATLFVAGALTASVYAGATACLRNPNDALAISNLGVTLNAVPDRRAAIQVLLYADHLSPKSPLVAINLAWAYFDAGHTDAAQKQFTRAGEIDPHMAAAPGGLGLLASCRGDQSTARRMLLESLIRGFSGVMGAAFIRAREGTGGTEDQSSGAPQPPANDTPGSTPPAEEMIPPIPVDPNMAKTAASQAALEQQAQAVDSQLQGVVSRLLDSSQRIVALGQRAAQQPGAALELNRTFEKQMFMFRETVQMTFADRLRPVVPAIQKMGAVVTSEAERTAPQMQSDLQRVLELQQQLIKCIEAHDEICAAKVKRQMEEVSYRMCNRTKQLLDTIYAQNYKVWKQHADLLRTATHDLYAFTQPVIDQVYAPALNEYMQAYREGLVLTQLQATTHASASLADMARKYRELECVPPEPLPEPSDAPDPRLPKKKPEPCPLGDGISLKIMVVSMELNCEKVKIEAGEGLLVGYERNFVKKETKLFVGAGVKADTGLGDTKGGLKSPGFSASLKAGVEITIAGDRVEDVAIKGDVSAGVSAGAGVTGKAGFRLGLQDGPSLTGSFNSSAGLGPISGGVR